MSKKAEAETPDGWQNNMTTTCIFDQSGNLINIGEWDYQYFTNEEGEQVARNPLPEGAYGEEREVFIDEDGGRYIAKNPIVEGERWVGRFFSPTRLIQMKVWYDTFAAEDTPKLRAVYDWTGAITIQAAQGQTTFDEPPHTFEELVAEAMGVLGVAP